MRKMKRKSKKHEVESQESDNENEASENNETNNSQSERESSESSGPDSEPETKKRKSDKRKSVSFSKKNTKKDTEGEEEQGSDEEEENYEVEQVLADKMVKGVRHYLIRWKGYEAESDTWEPESTVNCPELVKQYKLSQSENGQAANSSKKSNKSGTSKENKEKGKTKSKKSKDKVKSKVAEEVDWDSNDEFEVDRIIDVYFKKNGQREFLVSWKGYPSSQDSWEPEENLTCSDIIKRFMAKVEEAKQCEAKELRVNPPQTARLTLRMYEGGGQRRLSRRLGGKQRIQYHDAE